MLHSATKLFLCLSLFLSLCTPAWLPAQVVLSEFQASNLKTLRDEDGNFEDWIELCNVSNAPVDLGGWYLTDDSGSLTKWQFPATNLAAGQYLIVFASNKDRRTPGQPLHTNFKLSMGGEYLALVQPDGVTLATAYAPKFPPQVDDRSYGLPMTAQPVTLLARGAAGKLLVPPNAALGSNWVWPTFNDTAWTDVQTAVGFDLNNSIVLVPVADSVADWSANGLQGSRGWYYGYYDKSADATAGYQTNELVLFPRSDAAYGPSNYWTGKQYRWPSDTTPWDTVGQTAVYPSGANSGAEHWVVRRWRSATTAVMQARWRMYKTNPTGSGVTGQLYLNGLLKDAVAIAGNDTTGVTRDVMLGEVRPGDLVDLVLSATGPDGDTDDGGDATANQLTLSSLSYMTSLMASQVAGLMCGSNATAYLRLPFVVNDPASLDPLKLRISYNDGFIAYLNGVPVAQRNAPVAAAGGRQADSLADWSNTGQQGFNNWYYGYYDPSADADGVYDAFTDFNSTASQWTWNGGAWVLGPGDPPWDMISQGGWRPNGTNSAGVHWPIRRWLSQTAGQVTCHLAFGKETVAGGNGATLHVFQNGVERFTRTIAFNEASFQTDLVLLNLQAGDYLDFALDPKGTDGSPEDTDDGCTFSVVIDQDASAGPVWNSTATAARNPQDASVAEEISLPAGRDLLVAGTNVLAIQALNCAVADRDFLILPELISSRQGMSPGQQAYLITPTPGARNVAGSLSIGPIISEVRHTPEVPGDNDDLIVQARVIPTLRPVRSVTLRYRVMFGGEVSLPMYDDGLHDDGAAGDCVYAARIPASASIPGQMVRYCLMAIDMNSQPSRLPAFLNPLRSPQYFGTVVVDPALTNSLLPVLHWFIATPSSADSDATARCSVFFNGEFYDNIGVNLHGQSTRGFPKKSYDFDFNPGNKFRWSDDAPRVGDLNLLTTWADKTHMRHQLAMETYRDGGAPSHFAFAVRVQQNRLFYSVANVVESGDDDFLSRLGLDPQGALYKMYNSAESVAGAEKKTRKAEGTADLQALITGLSQATSTAQQAFMYDNLNVPEVVDFLAAKMITADIDCCFKNYYLYRDSDGTGEWQFMPWDVDLSFGHVWTCGSPCYQYFDQTYYTNQSITVGNGNTVMSPIYATPATRQMMMRRLRSLMDQLLQPPGTPATNDFYRLKTTALRDQIAPDATLDLAKWGTWGTRETITQAVSRVWNEFLPGRRAFLYQTMASTNGGEIPPAQATNVLVRIAALEYRPSSGNPLQEWLSLANTNNAAVDLSDWQLDGAVRFKFKPGTVIPAQSSLFVSPDVKAFRSRQVSPKGGERRLVVGPYEGNLSAWGESLWLLDPSGRLVHSNSYAGSPSLAQQFLRITEIFYNPDPLPGHTELDAQLFEFLELRNIGTVPLDLRGVRLSEGVQFDFATGTITNLAAGARLLVVRDTNAFALRYGSGLSVAGQFTGKLDNNGERLRLEDSYGEKILDFSYNNTWYPITDGPGFSLVIVDDSLPWSLWGEPTNWFAAPPTAGAPNPSNLPPTVQLTSPVTGAVYRSPTNVSLLATAADADGTIQRVEFHADGQLLGQVSTPPYAFVWTNPPPGTHTLTALALDNRFGATESAAVPITVLLPPPLVSLSQPADRTVVLVGSNVSVTATATSSLAGIDHVGFYVGGQLFAQMYAPPYAATISSATPTTWELTAVAVDTLGTAATSAVVRVAFTTGSNAPTTLVPTGALWNYLDDGSNQGTNWIAPGFPDTSWKSGPAELGYGDKLEGRPETTEISYGPNATNKWVTYYFRHAFTVAQPAYLQGLRLSLLRDDGAVVYLNGKEAFRSNLPEGPIDYLQLATNAVFGVEETLYYPQPVDAALVCEDTNVLAVEVHQASRDSSDLSFDLAFTGTRTWLAPAILGQPVSQQVQTGGTAVFSVDAGGTTPLSYQWRLNNAPLPNATASVLVITNVQTGNVGLYQVFITNSVGQTLSTSATLSLTNSPPNPGTNHLSILRLPTGYRLRYCGPPARACDLQRSVDLTHWDTLATLIIPAEGLVEYLESSPPANGAYYRVRQQ